MHNHGSGLKTGKIAKKIVLVGNPNVGKSVIFNHLTGKYVTVSNYPGTTVEVSSGFLKGSGNRVLVIDSPGVQSLFARTDDEKVTVRILLEENPDVVVLVADAKNLKRALMLLYELSLFKFKTILVLNMWDEARARGIEIDERKLSEVLKIPVVKTVAIHGRGIRELFLNLDKASIPEMNFLLDRKITEVQERIKKNLDGKMERAVGLIHLFLAGNEVTEHILKRKLSFEKFSNILKIREEFEKTLFEPVEFVLLSEINKHIDSFVKKFIRKREIIYSNRFVDFLHNFMIHPFFGFLFIGFILYLLYLFVGVLGAGILVDLLEGKLFGEFINPLLIKLFNLISIPSLIKSFFVGEFGVFTMALTYGFAIIFPVVLTFFIAFGILEDSGYFPRLAFLLNNFLKKIGLSGRAVLPLILGLGCDTMATVTTRTLETKKEKVIVTLLLALGVPCSAQMGVIMALMAGVSFSAFIIWGFTVLFNLILVGFLASKILKGEEPFFIMEIPPLRIPSFRNIFYKTMARVEWYLKEVIPIFIIGTAILFIFDVTHILAFLEGAFKPVVTTVLGLPQESAIGFIMGFLRRDYGAAGFFILKEKGLLDASQIIVSTVTITLFMPCIANFLVIIKERGVKTAVYISLFIIPYAVLIGYIVRIILEKWPV